MIRRQQASCDVLILKVDTGASGLGRIGPQSRDVPLLGLLMPNVREQLQGRYAVHVVCPEHFF
jgi:hypothetical protein